MPRPRSLEPTASGREVTRAVLAAREVTAELCPPSEAAP
jgi:hypothetical protein